MRKDIPWKLIIGRQKQLLTPEEEQKLGEWLSDEKHQVLYSDIETIWNNIRETSADYTPDTDFYWKELSRRMQKSRRQEQPAVIPIRRFRQFIAAASVLLLIAVSGTYFLLTGKQERQIAEVQRYSIYSGKSKVLLPDGTEVWLHGKSTLAYTTGFCKENREVSVDGEAYFSVTHDKESPFIVKTDGMDVIVHGTKFNVESHSGNPCIQVSLVEGSVAPRTDSDYKMLKPGEAGIFDKQNNSLSVEKADVEYASLWTADQIRFEQKNLKEICRSLSKWYNIQIDLDPTIAEKYAFTFSLRDEPLEQILRIMSRINPITYDFDENNNLTITAATKIKK
ncbi:FecR family protein [Parabacteroides leei]|uniref:FecR family protein n=1 Tax=Parabacteroides leei TaxID=2939491 RepID=UPI003242DBDC